MNTLDSLKALAPKARLNLTDMSHHFDAWGPSYGVDTPARKQAFFAQYDHETDGFNTYEEYASGSTYEGRKDLGNTQPGDGKKFKGRGGFMTTGRDNYRGASRHLFNDDRLLTKPELLLEPENAMRSSLFFWKSHNLNKYADNGDFLGMTKVINGGTNGWQNRLNLFEKAKRLF